MNKFRKSLTKFKPHYLFSYKGPKLTEDVPKKGMDLLHDPLFNKGLSYEYSERDRLKLRGLIPPIIRTIEQQEKVFLFNYDHPWEEIARNDLD